MPQNTLSRTLLAIATAAAIVVPVVAQAGSVKIANNNSVDDAVSRLTAAIEKGGQKVFAVLDFQKGTASVGLKLRPTTQVIFGGPGIGGEALAESQTMALFVPLRMLAFEDEAEKVWLMYPDPADAAVEHGLPADHPAVLRMKGALSGLVKVAAGN
jgi:uncharacterized protein (DUF302 family)